MSFFLLYIPVCLTEPSMTIFPLLCVSQAQLVTEWRMQCDSYFLPDVSSRPLLHCPIDCAGNSPFYRRPTPVSLIQWLLDMALGSRFLTGTLVFLFNKKCSSSIQRYDPNVPKQTKTNPQGHTQTHSLTSCRHWGHSQHKRPKTQTWWNILLSEGRLPIWRKRVP